MSEGDSVHRVADRLRTLLLDGRIDEVRTPSRRTRTLGWPRRLTGTTVTAVDARGKHLFLHFDDALVLHGHLRMSGAWTVRAIGEPWLRPEHAAWIVLRRGDREAVQYDGPFLQLRRRSQVLADPALHALGPDVCVPGEFEPDRVLVRLRQDDPSRAVGDALLDQRTIAGVGNLWKVETCWALGVDPRRPLEAVSDDELRAMLGWLAPRIQRCARTGTHLRPRHVYGREGRRCPRCRERIREVPTGDDARRTFWCPGCQR